MLLDPAGKPLLSKEDEEKQTAAHKQITVDLEAFGEWQKARGLSDPSIEAIGRACLVAIFRALPYGVDGQFLDYQIRALQKACSDIQIAKRAEEKIRENLRAANEQRAPS